MQIDKTNKLKIFEYQTTETKSSIKSNPNLKVLTIIKNNSNTNNQNFFKCKKAHHTNITQHYAENKCGINCENLKSLDEMEKTIKELIDVNEKLKKINEFLVNSIKNKEDMYLAISKELYQTKSYLTEMKNKEKILLKNSSFVSGLNRIKINKEEKKYSYDNGLNYKNKEGKYRTSTKTTEEDYNSKPKGHTNIKIPKLKISLNKMVDTNFTNEKPKTLVVNNESIPNAYRPNSNLISYINSSHLKEILTNKVNSHYQKISDLGRNLTRKYKNQNGRSLLAMNDDEFKKIINLHLQKEIYELTFSDEEFIHAMRNATEEKLISYCDVIGSVIKDFQHGIKLIQRIKHFLNVSVNFVKSVLAHDTTACLIRNTCEILNCERTSLFVLDKNLNMLIVHSGDEVKKSEIKVPKDKGIVGACFESGQKIKVDDAYMDERFIKDIDKMTGYKTKSLLCMPLIDPEGNIFGVIESVNKRGGVFDNDDEELMEIFSAQASVVLKSSMNYDLNALYTYKLKMIIQFSLDINAIDTISHFTFLSESFIMTTFNNTICRFIYYDSNSDRLFTVDKFDAVSEIPKVGIINYVLKNKELYCCNSMEDPYYNNLADIETGYSIITFPILDASDENRAIAIIQFGYNGKLMGDRRIMNEFDMDIIGFYRQITLNWIKKRKNSFYKIFNF